ncbi:hypothetical protein Anapl_16238 [Anas platyrhynchos]|uniref:Uncharacterized protein n=1 Tax=Anas platyrhynchos TaxID=8839 RepID=R0KY23_ANAPL|nr:hypothetical protein Anapl_16238 [Anas platyrhynchos]
MLVSLTVSNKTFQCHNVNNRRSVTLAAGNPKCDVSTFWGSSRKEPSMMIPPVVAPLKLAPAAFQAKLFEVSFLSRLRDCKEAQGTAQSNELCLPTGAISDSALAFNTSELEAAQITESHPIRVPKSLCTDAVGVLEDLSGLSDLFQTTP